MHLPDPQLDFVQAAGLSFLTDKRLFAECGICIGFTTREGGVSQGPFASLNLGANTEDEVENVQANRRILAEALEVPSLQFIYPKQVHEDTIVVVSNPSQVPTAQRESLEGADGILVTCPDVAPLLCFADCVPVIIVSSEAFAVVHAGWRGVMARIAPKAVGMLIDLDESTDPADINVYVGPHIGGPCFETSLELSASFADAFGSDVLVEPRHVDLSRALMTSLEALGIRPERMIDAGLCTVCNNDEYFSYRAQDGVCGRHAAFCFRKEDRHVGGNAL